MNIRTVVKIIKITAWLLFVAAMATGILSLYETPYKEVLFWTSLGSWALLAINAIVALLAIDYRDNSPFCD